MPNDMNEPEKVQETKTVATFDPRKLRSIHDIVQDLSKDIPPKYLSRRKQGGTELTYISWHDATKMLDYYASGWSYEIREVMNIAGSVCITVRLSIPSIEGVIIRDATGHESEDKSGYGDPFSNSESAALRRAAAKFGLGRYLYNAGSQQNEQPNQNRQQSAPQNRQSNQSNQSAQSGGNRAGKPTAKQIGYLAKLAKDAHLSEIDVCLQYSDDAVEIYDQLTFDQCSKAIEELKP